MKLSSEARAELKKRLREHPSIRSHLPKLQDLNRLTKTKLVELATTCGIDVAAVAEEAKSPVGPRPSGFSDEDWALMKYSDEHPAFHGVIEFDVRLSILDKEVARKARITYDFTPGWEYFDLHKNVVMKGWESYSMDFEILAIPDGAFEVDDQNKLRPAPPTWTKVNELLEMGVISTAMDEAIYTRIEESARKEDKDRRRTAKKRPI